MRPIRARAMLYRVTVPQRYPICRQVEASTAAIRMAEMLSLRAMPAARTTTQANPIAGMRMRTLNLIPSTAPIRNAKKMGADNGVAPGRANAATPPVNNSLTNHPLQYAPPEAAGLGRAK